MKPPFALLFTDDGAQFLHRAKAGWTPVGDVPFAEENLDERFEYLRRTAMRLEPGNFATKLVIPEDQIHYASVEVPSGFPEDAEDKVREYLDGATPYALEDLAYSWTLTGERAALAAVARETLGEAEAFAVEHRMQPVSFIARPVDADIYPGEPFFGETIAARSVLGGTGLVEPDEDAIVIAERGDLPDITAATIELAPEPAPVSFSSRRKDAPAAPPSEPPEVRPAAAALREASTLAPAARAATIGAVAGATALDTSPAYERGKIEPETPEPRPDRQTTPSEARGPNRKRPRPEDPASAPRAGGFLAVRPESDQPAGFRQFGAGRRAEPEIEAPEPPRRKRRKTAKRRQDPVPPAPVSAAEEAESPVFAHREGTPDPGVDDVLPPAALPEPPAAEEESAPTEETVVETPAAEEPVAETPTLPEPAAEVDTLEAPDETAAPETATDPAPEPEADEIPPRGLEAAEPTTDAPDIPDRPAFTVLPDALPREPARPPFITPERAPDNVPRVGASVVPLRKPVTVPAKPVVAPPRSDAEALTVFGARPKPKEGPSRGMRRLAIAAVVLFALVLIGALTTLALRFGSDAPAPFAGDTPAALDTPAIVASAPETPAPEAPAAALPNEAPEAAAADQPEVEPPLTLLPALQVTEGTPPAPLAQPEDVPETGAAALSPIDPAPGKEPPLTLASVSAAAPPVPVIRTEIALGNAPAYQATAPAETTAPAGDEGVFDRPATVAAESDILREGPVLGTTEDADRMFASVSTEPAPPLPSRDPLDRAEAEATAALLEARTPTAQRAATEAFYAITGVWPEGPSRPSAPARSATPGVDLAAISPAQVKALALTLPDPAPYFEGVAFTPPPGALPPVEPTPEGALSDYGHLVYAGRPDAAPPTRPFEPNPALDAAIAEVVASVAPNAVAEAAPEPAAAAEIGQVFGQDLVFPDLAGSHPPLRPAGIAPAAEAAPEVDAADTPAPLVSEDDPPPAPLPGLPDTRPAKRPDGIAQEAPEAPATTDEAALAPDRDGETTLLSGPNLPDLRPGLRPDDVATAPEQEAPTDEATETALLSGPDLPQVRPRLRPAAIAPEPDQPAETDTAANTAVQVPSNTVIAASVPGPSSSIVPRSRPGIVAELAARAPAAAPEPAAVVASVAPAIPTRASVAKQATEGNAIRLDRINLIGVYGAPSERRALIRLPSGRYVKVQVGDRVDGGQVAAIGDSDLRYVKGGRNITLELPPPG